MSSPLIWFGRLAKILNSGLLFTDQGADPATPASGTQVVYTKTGGVYVKNSAGTVALLATSAPATPTTSGTVTSYTPVIQSAVSTITNANVTSLDTDGFLEYRFSTGATTRTFTLPAASNNIGRTIIVKKLDSGIGAVTITRAGTDTIDGSTTKVLTSQYEAITIICSTATTWDIAGFGQATQLVSGLSTLPVSAGTYPLSGTSGSVTGAEATLPATSIEWDNNGTINTGNNRFTPGKAGKYLISGNAELSAAGGVQSCRVRFYKNGVLVKQSALLYPAGAPATVGIMGSATLDLTATDYVEIRIYATIASGTWGISAGPIVSYASYNQVAP